MNHDHAGKYARCSTPLFRLLVRLRRGPVAPAHAQLVGQDMAQFTPQAVLDLYANLSDDDKSAFRRLLGQHLVAEELFLILGALPLLEQSRFLDRLDQATRTIVMPKLILEAIRFVRENPQATDEQWAKMAEEQTTGYFHEINKLVEAEVKEARDRKSDPETVKRNVEICDKRKQDKKKWTLGRLAKDYEMTRQSVVKIVKEEEKWRRLANRM